MKSFKKLNARGFSHHFVMAFIVMAAAIGGTYYLVASHAQTLYKNPYTCASQTMLQSGSKGACVSYLQYALTNSTTSPGIAVDGSFGPNTKLAVQKFQFANHVTGSSCGASATTCDGIVGPLTWAKINAFNSTKTAASLPKPVAAPAPVKTTAPAPVTTSKPVAVTAPTPVTTSKPVVGAVCAGTPSSRPTLSVGSTGNCVRYLQQQLKISQDGVFGSGTKAAVVAVQVKYQLTTDGVVGACTWTAVAGGSTSAACKSKTTSVTTKTTPVSTSKAPSTVFAPQLAYGVSSPKYPNAFCYADYKNVNHTNYVSAAACAQAKAADQANRKVTVNCFFNWGTDTLSISRQSCYQKHGTEVSKPQKRSLIRKITAPVVNFAQKIARY